MKAVKVFTVIGNRYEDMAATDIRLNNEAQVIEEYIVYLIAFYERGYVIGGMQPEKYSHGEDFFTKILEWRNIAISRKINNHISSSNQIFRS